MLQVLTNWFSPAKPIPEKSKEAIDRDYPGFRFRVLESTFLGYTTYYLVRNNFSPVSKELGEALSYTKQDIGDILAVTALTYGIGKFLMGALSDKSDPRKFMSVGLGITAVLNFAFGFADSYWLHIFLWGLNGLVQGMGWPPCGRSLGHWYSVSERGKVFAFWNIAHNVGGGLVGVIASHSAANFGWQYAFFVPGLIALFGSVYLFFRLVDTPQSVGLPPIEAYNNDYPKNHQSGHEGKHEQELSFRQLIIANVLLNKFIWLFSAINFFVYIIRYSLIDWGPTYLKEVKGANITDGGYSTLILEFGGIGSTLLMGWISDKAGGRRGMVSLICILPILFAFLGIIYNPPGRIWLDFTLFGLIGLFIYPPVMLLGVAGLDFTSKKAVGTAAGFIGLFGSLGRTAQGKGLGYLVEHYSWNVGLSAIVVCTLIAIALLAFTWNLKPRA
ncbi:glycerol-3-phosphate transporter [Leptospira ryugenii]|uniref:Glycerol-3-phosphate transporter n=1 Tax=Leptospira ryugenii TaxID=1917863 RepID=A0A2P2E289_9LEPT|nr:MFS transporter [Leptospira ryugenii]GBF51013.1 glycerol-3-phosphate transporter [Leptospira ryugenii]